VAGNRVAVGVAVPVALTTAVLARPALRAWVGPLYLQAAMVVVLLSAAVVVQSTTATSRSVFIGAAEPKIPTLIALGGLVIHVALAIFLGQRYGIDGVASGVLIASFLTDGVAMMLLTSRRYGVKVPSYLAFLARAHLLPAAAAVAVGLYLATGPLWHFVQTHARVVGVLAVIVAGLVILAVYFPIYTFTGLSPLERKSAFGRVRAAVRRKA
jgi:O-antigen/teichoic acid export membrane protein